MSLHDRIMGLSIWTESEDFNKGYMDGVYDSGQMAKEADELMAEMAEALKYYESAIDDDSPASWALIKYNAWKEQTK